MTEEPGSGWENKALRMQRAVMGTGKMEGAEAPNGMGGEVVAAGRGEGAAGLAPAVGEPDGSLAVLPSSGTGGGLEGRNLSSKANPARAKPRWGGSRQGSGAVCAGGAQKCAGVGGSSSLPGC